MKNYLLLFSCAFLLFFNSSINAQIITTIAGNDTATILGDGGQATNASISGPYGVTLDAAGNMFIADQYHNCIRKVNTLGIISTIAGNGINGFVGNGTAATAAEMSSPTGIAVDLAGNVYFSDMGNDCVRKISTSGIITTYAGTGLTPGFSGDGGPATSSLAKMSTPMGLAIDAAGNLFVAENGSCVIRKISVSGIISTVAGIGLSGGSTGDGGPATAALLDLPAAVALDAVGNIYIADCINNKIRKVNTFGIISTVAGNGIAGFSGDGGLATAAKLNRPTGIAVSNSGVLYITDGTNNRIRNVYPTGVIYTLAGTGVGGYSGDGGLARYATLYFPYGGFISNLGNFYVADYVNNVIRKTDSFVNHRPVFSGGHVQNFSVCRNSTADTINSLMAITETDTFQTENWTIVYPPAHGVVSAAYTTISTGSMLTPTGLVYTPTLGYAGNDSFKISVSDGIGFDTTTIYITVLTSTTTATITGLDTVCQGNTITLSASITSGIWVSSNTSIATVNSTGIVTGVFSGRDTILYDLTNACGTTIAFKSIVILSHDTCLLQANQIAEKYNNELRVYPNPNNGMFTINMLSSSDETVLITITNIVGEKIKEFTTTTNKETDIKLYAPNGLYLLTAFTSKNITSTKIYLQD